MREKSSDVRRLITIIIFMTDMFAQALLRNETHFLEKFNTRLGVFQSCTPLGVRLKLSNFYDPHSGIKWEWRPSSKGESRISGSLRAQSQKNETVQKIWGKVMAVLR